MTHGGKTVLVLGGGVGGLVAAHELRKDLPRPHRVVLIERSTTHLFYPSLLWLMIGQRTAQDIRRPLATLAQQGIEVIQGEITALDAAARTIQVDGQSFSGDSLIVSLGAELAPETVPGLAQAGYNLYTLEGMEGLSRALATFVSGKLALVVASLPYKCPAAPYEAAMLLEYFFRKRKIREQVTLNLYAGEPGPMGVAGPEVSRAVRDMIEQKGMHYYPDQYLTRVDPHARQLSFSSGLTAMYDLLAFVPPHQVPLLAIEAGLAHECAWVPVDRSTLETRYPGVYAIGDITGIPLVIGKPLPKAGVFAHGQAEVVAHNIAVAITGKGEARRFEGHGECFIEMGDGKPVLPVATSTRSLLRPSRCTPLARTGTRQRCCSRRTGGGAGSRGGRAPAAAVPYIG
jgi:sulfide:quinone oxidoreductase